MKNEKFQHWSESDLEKLVLFFSNGTSSQVMEKEFGRSWKDIRTKAQKLRLSRLFTNRVIDLQGKIFGQWEVLSFSHTNQKNAVWLCKCKLCGNTGTVSTPNLKSGASTRCHSCANKPIVLTGLSNSHWYKIRKLNRHRQKRIQFDITQAEAYEKFLDQNGKCALSGITLTLPVNCADLNKGNYTASLDRIDSANAYTLNNIQWVHKDINWMKNKFDQQYFIETCIKIANFNKREH